MDHKAQKVVLTFACLTSCSLCMNHILQKLLEHIISEKKLDFSLRYFVNRDFTYVIFTSYFNAFWSSSNVFKCAVKSDKVTVHEKIRGNDPLKISQLK